MDVKGHPKKPLSRDTLPLKDLVDSFLAETRSEEPGLCKYLDNLELAGKQALAGVLGRFDRKGKGALDATERLLARRVLVKLHRPGTASLVTTNRVLDYLDLNQNALLEESELDLCVEIIELFAKAESDNDTLSEFELQMLYSVLRHLDANNNGCIDPNERNRLREGLDDPVGFLEQQKERNPLLKSLLAVR